MSAGSGSPNLHELLGRTAWARRLARHLVRGDDEADDLLQNAWLVAAQQQRTREGEAYGWLAGVLRILGMRHARAAGRRREREAESAADARALSPDRSARPDELLEHVETQRRLSEALLALDEPYRTTILLRYFDELSAADIARRTSVPAGTIRWRLKEGLSRLRRQLEEREGGPSALSLVLARFAAPTRGATQGKWLPWTATTMGAVALTVLVVTITHRPPRTPMAQAPDVPSSPTQSTSAVPEKENTMKKSIGILTLAAGLAANSAPAALAGKTAAIPPSKGPRFWVPLGVAPVKGPPTAKVTIVAFMDYQAPFCARATQTMNALLAAHPRDLRYQVIQRPLPFHKKAPYAARAALAAAQQGRFWEMHEILLANQTDLDPADIERYAKKIGLDVARFKSDLASATVNNQADVEEANVQSLRIDAVPSFFLNGRLVAGAQPLPVFEKAVSEELAYADAVLKAGVQPGDLYTAITKNGATELTTTPSAGAHFGSDEDAKNWPTNEGGLAGADKDVFDGAIKVLTTNTDVAKACYDSGASIKPGLAGKVVVDVRLLRGQAPTILLHESTLDFPKVDNCIVKGLRTLRFPEGTAHLIAIRYMFTLPVVSAPTNR
jgi:RNA polymerase sigma factor (sigma-70 family)